MSMRIKFLFLINITSVSLLAAHASAEDLVIAARQELPACGCSTARGSEALVRSATGTVFVSRESGLGPARAQQRFTMPARILTGPKSASMIEIGEDCSVSIAENKSLEIRERSGQWCAYSADGSASAVGTGLTAAGVGTGTAAAAGTATAATAAAQALPLGVFGGLAAGTVAISTARDDDRVSR